MIMRKRMKFLKIGAVTIAMTALTQCASVQEVEVAHPVGGSFEVYASPAADGAGTRTSNDGLHTLWVQGDRFSLFHAAAGSTAYTSDGAFTVDNPSTGHAKGTVTGLGAGNYDWYMVYPYSSSGKNPSAVPVTVGAEVSTPQVQQGADNPAHLAGAAVPLAGRATAVASDQTPVLTVTPAVAVLAVNVTNPGEGDVRITEVRFRAPEVIVGAFAVNVTGASPSFLPALASEEAVLQVSGDAVLKKGESGLFYLVIKPFTAKAGSTLTLSVNGQERSVTLSSDATFSAGKIKTLNMTLEPSDPPVVTPYYFKRVSEVVSGHKYILVASDTKADDVLRLAHALPAGSDSGNLSAEDVTEPGGIITLYGLENAFTFFETESGWTLRQADGRYLYNNGRDNLFAGQDANAGYWWTVSFDGEGLVSILNRGRHIQYNPTSSVRGFQSRQTSSTVGRSPWLYELQNDEEAQAELLTKTAPGVYDYQGSSWVYEDGPYQTSVRTTGSTIAFRLFKPVDYEVVQITGIPTGLRVNDRIEIRVARYLRQVATHSATLAATVVKVEGGKAWLMADGGTGLVLLIQ